MKKYGLVFIVLLLLTGSMLFNYIQSTKLKTSISLSETLEAALQESDIESDALELKLFSLAEDLTVINIQLQDKTESIKLINDKLEANGAILESIDELITENSQLKKELNTAFLELNILEEENLNKIDEIILTEAQREQWDKVLLDILELLDKRISILEDGISGFSTLSIERIMVKQEIDFLESIYSDIEKLKKEIHDI